MSANAVAEQVTGHLRGVMTAGTGGKAIADAVRIATSEQVARMNAESAGAEARAIAEIDVMIGLVLAAAIAGPHKKTTEASDRHPAANEREVTTLTKTELAASARSVGPTAQLERGIARVDNAAIDESGMQRNLRSLAAHHPQRKKMAVSVAGLKLSPAMLSLLSKVSGQVKLKAVRVMRTPTTSPISPAVVREDVGAVGLNHAARKDLLKNNPPRRKAERGKQVRKRVRRSPMQRERLNN